MIKRDTRVQIIIVENGKYILLKHLIKKEDEYFWGLPGGGVEQGETVEEAAVREAWEETGLKVALLPFKVEQIYSDDPIYRRSITVMAVPLEGTAATGYEPEEDFTHYFDLVDLKWHGFYDKMGIDSKTEEDLAPFRAIVDSDQFIKRAGALVYRIEGGNIYYLLVSANSDDDLYILPQGHVENGENPEQTALRETLEEAGVRCKLKEHRGFFLHQRKTKCYKTDMFAAEYVGEGKSIENRQVLWTTLEQARKLNLLRETMQLIEASETELRQSILS